MISNLATASKPSYSKASALNYMLLIGLFLLFLISSFTPISNTFASEKFHIAIIGDSNNSNQLLLRSKTQKTLNELGLHLNIDSINSTPFIKSKGCNNNYDLIIPVGNDITKQLIENGCQLPMISVLTPSFGYYKIDHQEVNLSSVFLDQPASRYLELARTLSANIQNVSLIYSDYSEKFHQQLMDAAESTGLVINAMKIDNNKHLYRILELVIENGDVLLAVPDPYVYNRKTIKAIFLASYQNGVPIIGFSEAYTKAGAIISIHSDIENIAKQLAENIYFFYQNDHKLPKESYPKYFNVSTNNKVASSLGLIIENAESIQRSISKVQ